jgi:hypothetical protein
VLRAARASRRLAYSLRYGQPQEIPEFYVASVSVLDMPGVWGFVAVVSGLADGQAGQLTAPSCTFPHPRGPSRLTALEDTLKTGAPRVFRRSVLLAAVGILALVLTACSGVGGGQLPPDNVLFKAPASLGFTFSCEDKGGLNPPTGKLSIQLAYIDHGSNPIGSGFSIHGIVDKVDPVLESMICSGQNPPPPPGPPNELIFLGRYRLTSSAPAGFPSTCPSRETKTTPLCRFEVIVRDNDRNFAPSMGDFFSIKLSNVTALTSEFPDPTTVFYARAGLLSSGNLTVK